MTDQDQTDYRALMSQLDKVLASFVKDHRTLNIATRATGSAFMAIIMVTEKGDMDAVFKACHNSLQESANDMAEEARQAREARAIPPKGLCTHGVPMNTRCTLCDGWLHAHLTKPKGNPRAGNS